MGAMLVVVLDELLEESAELALVPDEGVVEKFVANGADPSLSERVGLWGTGWNGDHVGAYCGENVVEGAGVLTGAVADHEPDRLVPAHEEVAGGLGGPGSGGVGGDAGDVDSSGVCFDEEQDMESAQGDAVDTEEVGSDQSVGLAGDELTPRWPCAVRGGLAPGVAQNLPHR